MSLTFVDPSSVQLACCRLYFPQVKSITTTLPTQPINYSTATQALNQRVQAKINFAAYQRQAGLILATASVILYRKTVYVIPAYKMTALEMLKSFQGRSHILTTAWALVDLKTQDHYQGLAQTKIFFKTASTSTLTQYVNDYPVVNYLGGYQPQDPPILALINRLEGSLTNFLYQLPLDQILPHIPSS